MACNGNHTSWRQYYVWFSLLSFLFTLAKQPTRHFFLKLIKSSPKLVPQSMGQTWIEEFLNLELVQRCYSKIQEIQSWILLSLTRVSLSQQVSLAWCHDDCCSLFPVLSSPSWLLQMAALPESGSGFFLLKGSFFLSTVVSYTFRIGELIEVKFWGNQLVF